MTLPTGTVTFLFTDIEGSTRLMQELGERYVPLQVVHHELLRNAFRTNDGRELRTEGDSFFCVFASAVDACQAAATAQRSFAEHPWPKGGALRVRIGLHTGEAPLMGEEYIGLDVHHAARIAGAAYGGQVLVSEATQALVGGSLPSELTLRDLGTHRLRDLARTEHLFQLVVNGVPDIFPALRTVDGTPNNLPTQLTSFVGRGEMVARAKHVLEGCRLMTLTGPGGIGKTRLSLQVAAETFDQFPDGVYFVPLSAVRDPDVIPSVIAQSLSLGLTGNKMPLDAVKEHLLDRKVLLLMDNFEQLLPDAAGLPASLLQASPKLKVIVSSRAALRSYGEQEFPVEPLDLPDPKTRPSLETLSQFEAVKLFIERALAAKPDFHATNENAPAIAGICERVDGLPLAIELAAARIKLFSPQALFTRLEKSLSALGTGSRDLPGRQQTLAEASEGRLFGDERKAQLDRLELDHDNFRAALDWCIANARTEQALRLAAALWRFWQMRGHLREGRARVEAVLRLPGGDKFPEARRHALEAAGGIAYWQADMAAAQVWYDEALVLTRAAGDKRAIANAIYNDSFPRVLQRTDMATALVLLDEALTLYRELDDKPGIARCLWGIGNVYHFLQDYKAAVAPLDEAIVLFRGLDDQFGLGWALHTRALAAINVDDAATAEPLIAEAFDLFGKAGDISALTILLDDAAQVARLHGDRLRSLRLAAAAAAVQAKTGAEIAMMANAIGGRPTAAATDAEEKQAWEEGMAMPVDEAVRYALTRNS